jgi:hypothetical protein
LYLRGVLVKTKGPTMERNGCFYIAAVTVAFWAGVAGLVLLFI